MRMYIPEIGDILQLDYDWTFTVTKERRNDAFIRKNQIDIFDGTLTGTFTIPAGDLLKIDRIYIRKGVSYYSSVTFYWYPASERGKSKMKSRARFRARLEDVNLIQFSPLHCPKGPEIL